MSGTALAPPLPAAAARERRTTWIALAAGLAALGLLFRQEIAAAVEVWTESTAYNHCFLVLPIAAFLAWERRARLAVAPIRPAPSAALLVLPLGAAWLAAERLGVMEGRQLAAMAIAQVLVVAGAGWPLWRAFAGPMLYLFFLVPFGAFITPQLQSFTAHFTTAGLDLIGIPNYSDGNTIEIPQGMFYIAEACAGLRFLIASIAFGALYALMMYRSPGRRALFLAISVVVPVVANGFRALGIVVLGNLLGSAEAAATDHVLYGWIFFSIVILALTLLGLPFRQDSAPLRIAARPPAAPGGAGAPIVWTVVAAVVLTAAVAPAAAFGLSSPPALAAAVPEPPHGGCAVSPVADGQAQAGASSRADRFVCGGLPVVVRVLVFPPRAGAGAVIGARRALTQVVGAEDVAVAPLADAGGSGAWRLTEAREPFAALADSLWLGGGPAPAGLTLRVQLARASLLGADAAPVLIVVAPEIDWRREGPAGLAKARAAIARLLTDAPDLPAYARALSQRARSG